MRAIHIFSFYGILFCVGLTIYSWYAAFSDAWRVAPPDYVLLVWSLIVFVLGIRDVAVNRRGWARACAWFTLMVSGFLAVVLIAAMMLADLAAVGTEEHIKTAASPGGTYTLEVYHWDAGASGTFGIRAEQNGPLWFTKPVYTEEHTEKAMVEWGDGGAVTINENRLTIGN